MKLTLQDVVRGIAKATKLALPEANVVAHKILSTLEEGIICGKRIEIRDFGVFQTKTVSGKKGRDMARNLTMFLPAYKKLSFRAGKNIRNLFRDFRGDPEPAMDADGQLEMHILKDVVNR